MNDLLKQDSERFAKFVTENYPRARDWEDPVGWCAWNIAHGFIAVVCDGESNDNIVAMCVIRPVDRPGFGVLPFYFNEYGRCLHIDLLVDVTSDPKSIMVLRNFFMFRFGERETVTMFRHHEESIHVYPWRRYWNNLVRIKKRKRDKNEFRRIEGSRRT